MKKYYLVLSLILVAALLSCSNDDIAIEENFVKPEEVPEVGFLRDSDGKTYKPFKTDKENVYVILPNETDFDNIEFIPSDSVLNVLLPDGTVVDGGGIDLSDFVRPLSCNCLVENGDTLTKNIIVFDYPVLTIDTPDSLPILSKIERKKGCVVKLYTNDGVQELGTAGIRGRGNSTWLQVKKPYNVKLDKKASILGMKKSKHWILLANAYYDRTQIHNSTAFEIARKTDFPWVPSGHHVELFLNGEYIGLYYLCEKIGVEDGKIEISKAEAGKEPSECGYLIESYVNTKDTLDISQIDYPFGTFNTGIFIHTGQSTVPCYLGWEIKEPDEQLTDNYADYIKQELIRTEELIVNDVKSGEYRNYYDIETAVNWWLVEELCLNEEASRSKNIYMYKEAGGGKFTMGPPWDFDAWTFGQVSFEERKWNLDNTLYYDKLFQDQVFVNRLKEKWSIYKPIWEQDIPLYIMDQYRKIHRAAERNEVKWSHWNGRNKFPQVSYHDYILMMIDAVKENIILMDNKIASL